MRAGAILPLLLLGCLKHPFVDASAPVESRAEALLETPRTIPIDELMIPTRDLLTRLKACLPLDRVLSTDRIWDEYGVKSSSSPSPVAHLPRLTNTVVLQVDTSSEWSNCVVPAWNRVSSLQTNPLTDQQLDFPTPVSLTTVSDVVEALIDKVSGEGSAGQELAKIPGLEWTSANLEEEPTGPVIQALMGGGRRLAEQGNQSWFLGVEEIKLQNGSAHSGLGVAVTRVYSHNLPSGSAYTYLSRRETLELPWQVRRFNGHELRTAEGRFDDGTIVRGSGMECSELARHITVVYVEDPANTPHFIHAPGTEVPASKIKPQWETDTLTGHMQNVPKEWIKRWVSSWGNNWGSSGPILEPIGHYPSKPNAWVNRAPYSEEDLADFCR